MGLSYNPLTQALAAGSSYGPGHGRNPLGSSQTHPLACLDMSVKGLGGHVS